MKNISAYCGLYCGACKLYMETQKGRSILIEGEGDVKCNGCRTDEGITWCKTCTIKKCARSKNIDFCFQCKDFPCKIIEDFKNDEKYPYHTEVYDYFEIIKEHGENKWLEQMKKRWSCPKCREQKCWYDVKCETCGEKLNGYEFKNNK